ncbi:MAG TPA: PhzF family phenazine biosynthesis protein [Chloroflexi bacterium]|nr:PhzF family phenazine biosynthesis protein [Chloroflexota bacterium]
MRTKRYPFVYVDAFTSEPFAGNPCAVITDAAGLTDEQMQNFAREANQPESAFVLPSDVADFCVRYFTPRKELPFAGHPTIATAFALAQEGRIPLQEPVTTIDLEFGIGVLPVEIHVEDGVPVHVVMTQQTPSFRMFFTPDGVAPYFGLAAADLRDDCLPQVVSTGAPFLIVPVGDVETLGKVELDRDGLVELFEQIDVDAAFLFSIGGFAPDADTHARLFDPLNAIEDPFTGSATGAMGAYAVRYGLHPGPTLIAEQGHFVQRPGRGIVEIVGLPHGIQAVKLGGTAVKVVEGAFLAAGG